MIRGKQSPDMIIFLPPISLTFILSTHFNELLLGSVTKASSTQEQGGGLNVPCFSELFGTTKNRRKKSLANTSGLRRNKRTTEVPTHAPAKRLLN